MAKLNPKLTHKVLRNVNVGTWDVIGPEGYYHAYRNRRLANAIALFLSGDDAEAARERDEYWISVGLIQPK
jgi:hypothetical protein